MLVQVLAALLAKDATLRWVGWVGVFFVMPPILTSAGTLDTYILRRNSLHRHLLSLVRTSLALQGLVLVRVVLVATRHHNADGFEPMQNVNRVGVSVKDRLEFAVGEGAFVRSCTA
jgi:hypothetical protein